MMLVKGGVVARAIAARMSMIKLIHRSWIAFKGDSKRQRQPTKTNRRQVKLQVTCIWRKRLMLVQMLRPHMIDLAKEMKSLLTKTILADCLARLHPVPIANETSAVSIASTSLRPSPTTITFLPSIIYKPLAMTSLSFGSARASTLRFTIACLNACILPGSY